jgi:hypothetical protein
MFILWDDTDDSSDEMSLSDRRTERWLRGEDVSGDEFWDADDIDDECDDDDDESEDEVA